MKKPIFILIVIVLIVIINSLLHSIYDLWHKQDLLVSAQKTLDAEKLKNQKLKSSLYQAQSEQFVEEQAHNKLFMVKKGEQEVLISQDILSKERVKKKQENLPNWQKWVNLFL